MIMNTPFCGFATRTVDGPPCKVVARTAPHVLVTGPPGIGKTRRILTPAAVTWPGPATIVSSKDDLIELVSERRTGPKTVIDLRPVKAPVYPPGVTVAGYDPTTTITTPMEALTVAETIMAMSTVGLGSTEQFGDSGVWEANAAGPLAAFLYAASPVGNNGGIRWVLRAVDNVARRKKRKQDGQEPLDLDGDGSDPGWKTAAKLCGRYEELALGLERIAAMGPGQRDSVAITMRKAITPWLRTALAARYDPKLAAPAFNPAFLDDPQATLFVLAPADGTVAGAAVTLLDSLVRRWRDKTAARDQTLRPMLLIIDELPNTAPIPTLRRIIGEARGLSINMMAAVQATCQLATVYGRDYCDELRAIFPAVLVMKGALEREVLEAAQDWSQFTTRHPETSQESGQKTLSSELGPRIRWQELLPKDREHARLLVRGDVGEEVEIPDWSVFRDQLYDVAMKLLMNGSPDTAANQRRALAELNKQWSDPRP
jgi:hypothetical protein